MSFIYWSLVSTHYLLEDGGWIFYNCDDSYVRSYLYFWNHFIVMFL